MKDCEFGFIRNERLSFWSRGNMPTQQALGLTRPEVLLHLKALYMLSDRVLGAASFFFESDLTRGLLQSEASMLLSSGELLLFVNEEIEDFEQHGLGKIGKSPLSFGAYSNETRVRNLGRQLNLTATVLHRPSSDISGAIVVLWLRDLSSSYPGHLGSTVAQLNRTTARDDWSSTLTRVAEDRSGDFVWEYIGPILMADNFPLWSLRQVRRRLLQLYTDATGSVVTAYSDAPGVAGSTLLKHRYSEFDTGLLLACLRALGFLGVMETLSFSNLARLKATIGWQVFFNFYLELVAHAASNERDMERVVPAIEAARTLIAANQPIDATPSRQEFVQAFSKMLALTSLARQAHHYRKIGDKLFQVVDAFGQDAFGMLELALHDIRSPVMSSTGTSIPVPWRISPLERTRLSMSRCFIVHGHDMGLTYELKDYLQNTLRLPEPVILAQQRSGGRTIIEKFEDLSNDTDFVLVLVTPDDSGPDPDRLRARQNVVFELGFFVGRLGRLSGRVIVLVRGSVEIPSDLSGVIYINVTKGIAEAGEEIRREMGR